MKLGITGKLFVWYLLLVLIFLATISWLYSDVRRMMAISRVIVSGDHPLAEKAEAMLAHLLAMEENERKYRLLKSNDYYRRFLEAQRAFASDLASVMALERQGVTLGGFWHELDQGFQQVVAHTATAQPTSAERESLVTPWIAEGTIASWMEGIAEQRRIVANEAVSKSRELHQRGLATLRNGMIGLGFGAVVGLAGILFLSSSMVRPLKQLQRGIRNLARERSNQRLPVGNDEFGELATAFNEMARRLSEEEELRTEFISTLSHEIRTPLTSIRESVNLLTEEVMGPTTARQRKFLTIAGDEIGRICELLDQLLQVSRLETGSARFVPHALAPYPVMAECLKRLQPAAAAKGVHLELDVPPDTPHVWADPAGLEQVLANLVGNAIKFSDPEGHVRVKAAIEPGAPDRLRFLVIDDGPGIAIDEQPRIFDRYYRGRDVRSQTDGVGLGLNIVRRSVEALGGTVGVQSMPGVGSTFHFSLRRAPAQAALDRSTGQQRHAIASQ